MNAPILTRLTRNFQELTEVVPLRPIRSKRDYAKAVASLDTLLDAGAARETHPLADLAATLGELIGDYEDRHVPRPEVSGTAMLRFLMDQHGLKQADLPEIGSQGVVSEILSGKRELNARQIKALATRFKTQPAAFL
jgi:HTH-type transcriptional regulator / antitoxin HigA